jgi:hypothetical protein
MRRDAAKAREEVHNCRRSEHTSKHALPIREGVKRWLVKLGSGQPGGTRYQRRWQPSSPYGGCRLALMLFGNFLLPGVA